jgi:hypothetical protein
MSSQSFSTYQGRSNSMLAEVPQLRISIGRVDESPIRKSRTAQNIKEQPANCAPAYKARRRLTPGSCNGLFSAGFPTGVQGLLPHLTQRTSLISFPLPSWGRPQGHREALLLTCNFQRVAHANPYCKLSSRSLPAFWARLRCNYPRVAIAPLDCKLRNLWKASVSVGNAGINASGSDLSL